MTEAASGVGRFFSGKKMKRISMLLVFVLAAGGLFFLAARPAEDALALPEYSAQTGEPCATCHLSPSGGGARGPRGQAWVGSGKPGTVPDLIAALESLGVHFEVEEGLYKDVPESIPAAAPLPLNPERVEGLHGWLQDFDGN
jgi:hypothetical protein